MSVLKSKRTESKAEYVNVANAIYIETINFLTRISARYSRLIAEPVAKLAGEVIDHAKRQTASIPPTISGASFARHIFWRRGHP